MLSLDMYSLGGRVLNAVVDISDGASRTCLNECKGSCGTIFCMNVNVLQRFGINLGDVTSSAAEYIGV